MTGELDSQVPPKQLEEQKSYSTPTRNRVLPDQTPSQNIRSVYYGLKSAHPPPILRGFDFSLVITS